MNDVETRIRDLINESVDAELGPRRSAPPFDTRSATRKPRRWGPWATPLLAAAAVAALIGGTVAVAHVATSHRHQSPATPVPAPPTTAPTTPSSAPTTHASKPPVRTQSKATTGGGAGNTVQTPSDLEAWIIAQPHPQVSHACTPGHFAILGSTVPANLTGGPVPDAVVRVYCADSAGATQFEIDVYGAVRGQFGLVYRVPAGTTTNGIERVNGTFSVSGNTLTNSMGGYAQGDAMCCPSSQWTQAYTFDGTSVSQGPLVQTSGPNLITFTSVGSLQLGMTAAQVHAAEPSLSSGSFGTGCTQFGRTPGGSMLSAVLTPPTNRVIGIYARIDDRTDTGIGVGSTRDQVRAAYADRHIEETSSYGGQEILVQGPSSWLGFTFGQGTTVKAILVGSHDFAATYELCVGPTPS
jgi:hypothetical protein